jgi:hypothetical protein
MFFSYLARMRGQREEPCSVYGRIEENFAHPGGASSIGRTTPWPPRDESAHVIARGSAPLSARRRIEYAGRSLDRAEA